MNFPLFIAHRLYRKNDEKKSASRPAVLIAMLGIAIGTIVLLLTMAVVSGFKKEIKDKITGFSVDVRICSPNAGDSFEAYPIDVSDSLKQIVASIPNVEHVQRYVYNPGLIKTDDAFQGIVLKGIGSDYDTKFLKEHIIEGEMPVLRDSIAANEVVVSKLLADKLNLHLGDKVLLYFFQGGIKVRKMKIAAVYETHFNDYDKMLLITDLTTAMKINRWNHTQVSGLEVKLKDVHLLDNSSFDIMDRLQHSGYSSEAYTVYNFKQLHPQIFAWLDLLDINFNVIILLMIGVAGFTVISGLLIIIIERTSTIGILKSFGATNGTLRKIFLWFALFVVGRGVLWGNIIGLSLYFTQRFFHPLRLDASVYYMDRVPMNLSVGMWILLNLSIMLVALLILVLPSYIITKIRPIDAMRYE